MITPRNAVAFIIIHPQISKRVTAKLSSVFALTLLLSTFIKLPFVIKIFVSCIFEWPLYTGFTVLTFYHLVSSVVLDRLDPDQDSNC